MYCMHTLYNYRQLSHGVCGVSDVGMHDNPMLYCMQDKSGDTALHYAVLSKEKESVSILLEAGSNPKLVNLRLSNPIHEAANTGFLS